MTREVPASPTSPSDPSHLPVAQQRMNQRPPSSKINEAPAAEGATGIRWGDRYRAVECRHSPLVAWLLTYRVFTALVALFEPPAWTTTA
jgi:hypothetical protein